MAVEILGLIAAGAGAGYIWRALRRWQTGDVGKAQFEATLDTDVAVAFGVARHAMTSRGHRYLRPLHLLYGLLQVDTFTQALERLGGVPDAIETRVLAALDERAEDPEAVERVGYALGYVYQVARITEREVSLGDLWARIGSDDELAALLEVDPDDLLFVLVHGMPQPTLDLPGRSDVHVVLRNDDITTQELVTNLLRDVFELADDDAHARMMQTHTQGKTIVGRYKLAVARDKVIRARTRAREEHAPLWIGLEDC